MFREIHNFGTVICKMTSNNLEELVKNHCDYLPFWLHFTGEACYVKYDTQNEVITDISLRVIDRNGLAVEIDPINGYVRAIVAGNSGESIMMPKDIADTLFSCIHQCWNMRMHAEGLVTTGNDRYIAADLLG